VLLLGHARLAFGYEANNKLNVAVIGAGGQGQSNLVNIANLGENIVALCDVDSERAAEPFQKFAQAKVFQDFRRMLEDMGKSIDAVVVSTPDHTHAVAVATALRMGKHVYCEKPLTRTVREARVLRQLALEHKVVTQMGNQGSAEPGMRRAVELVWGGVIGDVREAHVWFASGNQPQQIPKDQPPVPETLAWDLWLGPAPYRPYHPSYLPAKWRGWRAFGSGIIGDFGCHTSNIMFRALRLEQLWGPLADAAEKRRNNVIKVEANPSERDREGYPKSMSAVVRFPRRGKLPPVKATFYAKSAPKEELLLGHPRGPWGDLLVGAKGSLYSDCPWNTRYALLPRDRFQNAKKELPPETLPRSKGHHREWVDACKGEGRTFSGFEIGGPMTELMQLINAASLVEGSLEYDPLSGRVLNSEAADQLMHRDYRQGWSL